MVATDTDTPAVDLAAQLAGDSEYMELRRQRDEAKARYDRLNAEKAQIQADLSAPEPPFGDPGGFFGIGRQESPAHQQWRQKREAATRNQYAFTSDKAGKGKELADAEQDYNGASLKLEQRATKVVSTAAQAKPDIRTVNGVPMERGEDGVYRPVRVGGADGTTGATPATGTTTPSKAGTVTKMEKGPDGATYAVTYNVDAAGNQTWDGKKPTRVDLGTDPGAAIELQTAQLKLQQAQQALANEQDPLKRRQLQTQVEQAQFALEQARAKAPIDLQIAQTNLAQAQQNLNRPSVSTVGGRAVGINPQTGERVFSTDLMSPEERARTEEVAALDTEARRRGQLPTNAVAAYSQERTRLQARGQQELDRLTALQQQGAMSAAEAQREFERFFRQNVEAPLSGLQTQAEEYLRAERERQETAQREENWRAYQANQAREQLGLQAGQQARQQLIGLAPQIRTPQFLAQYGQAVANLSQRAGAPNAEAALALPAGQRITADTFNPANFKGAIPDLEAYARQASDRALAAISPAVAAQVGRPLPQLPSLPELPNLLAQVPYQGPLSAAPKGITPLPGQEAIDLGPMGQPGMARTYYSPTSYLDWQIPA
jgi:hypothetical protein